MARAFGQEFQRPAEGKSLVYFTRYGGALALIDFRYFDGQKYLGRVVGNNYFFMNAIRGNMFSGFPPKTMNLSRVI